MQQIPLKKKRKEPRDRDWPRRKYSVKQISTWVEKGGNVGLRLEATDLVIDVDPKHDDAKGKSAKKLLRELAKHFDLDFSKDSIVQTGGKKPGLHVHLTKPSGVKIVEKLKGLFGSTIEFKSVGRQVLAPGCTHPDGGKYRKIQNFKRRPCPPALLEAITRPATKSGGSASGIIPSSQMAEALAQLDATEFQDYDEWRDLMFAVHHGTGGSIEGRDVFKAWSATDEAFADAGGDVDIFWEAASYDRDEGRTIDTLHWHLSQRGLGMPPGDPREDFADLLAEASMNPTDKYTPKWRMDKKGKIRAALVHNIREAMKVLGHEFYRDDFSGDIYLKATNELLTDDHLYFLGEKISDGFGVRFTGDPSKDKRQEAVVIEAHKHHRHPIREYLEALKWDGKKRMNTWLIDFAGAEPSRYVRAISEMFLLGAIARVMHPGCKFDMMLVLEGWQGTGKSSLVNILGGRWALEGLPPLKSAADKDVVDAMRGYWIVEMEEMATARKAEIDVLKAFITRRVDRVRLPYERNSRDFPRQCVFVGTVNEAEWLRDSTGNRRFAPIEVHRVDESGLLRVRDQLWAETFASWKADQNFDRLKLKESLWEIAAEEQEKRRMVDPLEAEMAEALSKFAPGEFFPSETIMREAGLISLQEQQRGMRMLGNMMKRLGCRKDRRRVNGQLRHGWITPKEEEDFLL